MHCREKKRKTLALEMKTTETLALEMKTRETLALENKTRETVALEMKLVQSQIPLNHTIKLVQLVQLEYLGITPLNWCN